MIFRLPEILAAIREGMPLTCTPEVAYETAVSVLKVNEAIEKNAPVSFDRAEFRV